MEEHDSGSFWAGLFIARLIKSMQSRRKYKTKKAECISEFNNRKDYSKMLRRIEEEDRKKDEEEAALKLPKTPKKYAPRLLLRSNASRLPKAEIEIND